MAADLCYTGTEWDRRLYVDDFKRISSDSSRYLELLSNLITGLSADDVEEVYRILHRLNLLLNNRKIFYSDLEKKALKEIEQNFYKKIYTLDSELHVYENYYLPYKRFEQPVFWYRHGLKLLANPNYIKGKDVIDAGAYIGDSALILSEYTEGIIYSFEADEKNYELIYRTMQMNKRKNIIPVNMALSNEKGSIKLYGSDILDSCNSVLEEGKLIDSEKVTEVRCTTIDDFVKENNCQIGLIKTDVEGAEKKLLEGAINTIRAQKPTMIISIYHSMDDFFMIKPWIEKLELGYQFKLFRPIMKGSFMCETVLICEVS